MYLVRSDSLKYIFPVARSFGDHLSIQTMVDGIPETNSDQNILLQIMGQDRDVDIDALLIDSDTDLSDGTNSSEVKTVKEQYNYLMENFFNHGYQYILYLDDGSIITNLNVSDLDISYDATEPTFARLKVTFKRGSNVEAMK